MPSPPFSQAPPTRRLDYEVYDLVSCLPQHLSKKEQDQLLALLQKYQDLFQGKLGRLPGPPLDLELKPGADPVYCRPYPIPRSQEAMFKKEVDRMVNLGILKPTFDSPWGSPSFGIPKKNGSMRFVTDLRQVNKRVVRKPYLIPKVSDIFTRLNGFTYATALDFNMGFYHVPLSQRSQQICTTVLPFGKYSYERMPMGLLISPDVFQYRMDALLGDLSICYYLY